MISRLQILSCVLLAMSGVSDAALFGFGTRSTQGCESPCVPGDESIMRKKAHGTSKTPVQDNLRWGCDHDLADRIANFNRHYAERSGYWETTSFIADATTDDVPSEEDPVVFYDSNTGKPLYQAPIGRTWDQFLAESRRHGWPSFRDAEVNWDNVRVLENGETVSINGAHLGHNLPDAKGNRFCINLVCIAGNEKEEDDGRK